MAFQIIWSETASEDLKEIVRFIALDNSSAAARLAEKILSQNWLLDDVSIIRINKECL